MNVSLAEVGAASVRFEYRLVRTDGTLLTEGMTRLACIDAQLTLRRLTPEIIEFLRQPELPSP